MKQSYWEKNTFFKDIDVAIIGSGIVGLSAAIHLKKINQKLNVVVLEKGILPSGASTRNAGFACFGSVSELLDDLKHQPEDAVFALLEKRWKGLLKLKSELGTGNIKYKALGSYELFRKEDDLLFEACADQLTHLNKKIKVITGEAETFKIKNPASTNFAFKGIDHLIYNKSEGQIDTGAMMKTLITKARRLDIEVLNGIAVSNIKDESDEVCISTENDWQLKSSKVLIATNGFTKKILPNVKVDPARNLVVITKPISKLAIKGCFHFNKGFVYFRNIDNRILLGGGRNIDVEKETTENFGHNLAIKEYLTGLLSKHFLPDQNYEVDSWWSGIMGISKLQDKTPIVNKISGNIYVAVRLGGMGIAIGMLIGKEGAEKLLEIQPDKN